MICAMKTLKATAEGSSYRIDQSRLEDSTVFRVTTGGVWQCTWPPIKPIGRGARALSVWLDSNVRHFARDHAPQRTID